MPDKPDKPQEQPKPNVRPVPQRQDDPLLGDYFKKSKDEVSRETRKK
jgi:hypothetical protein